MDLATWRVGFTCLLYWTIKQSVQYIHTAYISFLISEPLHLGPANRVLLIWAWKSGPGIQCESLTIIHDRCAAQLHKCHDSSYQPVSLAPPISADCSLFSADCATRCLSIPPRMFQVFKLEEPGSSFNKTSIMSIVGFNESVAEVEKLTTMHLGAYYLGPYCYMW